MSWNELRTLQAPFSLSAAIAGERAGERWEAVRSGGDAVAPFAHALAATASHLSRLATLGTLSPAIAAERGCCTDA